MTQDLDKLAQRTLQAAGAAPVPRRIKRVAKSTSPRLIAARKRRFLKELAEHGNIGESARVAGVSRQGPYVWAEADPEFKAAWEEAQENAIDKLELEARRRAEVGVEEPIYQGGKLVGYKTRYSDGLLEFVLGGLRPEKYRNGPLFGRGEIGQVTFTLDFGFAKQAALEGGPPALEGEVIEGSDLVVKSQEPLNEGA